MTTNYVMNVKDVVLELRVIKYFLGEALRRSESVGASSQHPSIISCSGGLWLKLVDARREVDHLILELEGET